MFMCWTNRHRYRLTCSIYRIRSIVPRWGVPARSAVRRKERELWRILRLGNAYAEPQIEEQFRGLQACLLPTTGPHAQWLQWPQTASLRIPTRLRAPWLRPSTLPQQFHPEGLQVLVPVLCREISRGITATGLAPSCRFLPGDWISGKLPSMENFHTNIFLFHLQSHIIEKSYSNKNCTSPRMMKTSIHKECLWKSWNLTHVRGVKISASPEALKYP